MRLPILLFLLLVNLSVSSQISIQELETPYYQDFNSLPVLIDGTTYSWVNNTTIPGWYIYNKNTTNYTFESSANSTNNNGGIYVIYDKNDFSLGSKASNATNHLYYGVRFKNNTGLTIYGFDIKYQGEQWNISENGVNVNKLQMHYQKDNKALTNLNNGNWHHIPTMDFVQLFSSSQSASMGGSSCSGNSYICLALDGNLSSNKRTISNVTRLELAPDEEIIFRWQDLDDNNNDHHLQIDDIKITPTNNPILLPISLLNFEANIVGNNIHFEWETSSERNNNFFEIELLEQESDRYVSIGRINGNGNTSMNQKYEFNTGPYPNDTYYFRLKQTDFNGTSTYTAPISVEIKNNEITLTKVMDLGVKKEITFNQRIKNSKYTIQNLQGDLITNGFIENETSILFNNKSSGIHILKLEDNLRNVSYFKLFLD